MGIICVNIKTRCNEDKERKIKTSPERNPEEDHERDNSFNSNKNPNDFEIVTNNIPYTKKHNSILNINNQKLKDFINEMIYQGLKDDTKDFSFNELIKIEMEILKREIQNMREDFEYRINKNKIFDFNKIKDTIIINILNNDFSNSMIKKKISDIAKGYEYDKSKYSFKYLKILLVGRKKIGKTDLIQYILELNPNEIKNMNKREELNEYKSERVPYLRLVEYRGIGFDKDSNPEIIGTNICNYINNLQRNDYNDFIHCVWYCITETKFEAPEIAVLKKLKTSYKNDNVLPVITVYTKTESAEIANKMEQHIKNQNIDTLYIKTLAKSFETVDARIQEAFGRKELLESTLNKCTQSLQGDLINLMAKKISEEIQNELINKNRKILQKVQEKMITKFVSEFNYLLEDGDLIDYLINIIIENLKEFKENNISNKSFNLLNNSEFIKELKEKIEKYKSIAKHCVELIIQKSSEYLLNEQAKIEIKKGNMDIKNKRKLEEIKKTNEIFLKKNLYFIAQKLLIAYLIEKIFKVFFDEFKIKFDAKIKKILNINNNPDIKSVLSHTFLVKLKDFGEKWGIDIKNNNMENDIIEIPERIEAEGDEEKQNNHNLNNNSLNNYEIKNDEEEDENNNIIPENNWFPFNKIRKWEYIKDISPLVKYLNTLVYQDSELSIETNDQTFELLKTKIKKYLIIYLNKKKLDFITNIDKFFSTKKFPFEKVLLSNIIEKENISLIYDKKIKGELDKINKNFGDIKIDFISIILVGRSGIGKSKLINALLKEECAPNGVGYRVTLQNDFYQLDNNLRFLRLIDTRGTELDEKVSLEKIVKNVKEVINKMKIESQKEKNLSLNIQCIYYCVKGSSLEESEIKAIEEIKKNSDSIPVIVVFTMGINKNDIREMKNLIDTRLNIPFINVLAEKMGQTNSYGLNDLIKLTLDICKKSVNGNVYKSIREKIKEKIISNMKEINKNIKFNISNNILEKILNFDKVKKRNELYDFIYSLLEIEFIEYMDEQNENLELKGESKIILKNSKLINDYVKEFIEFYEKQSKEIIKPILENDSLKFLDMQVKLEKKLFKSIEVENKNDRESFKKIINNFLNSNFYYISQKYLIYKLLSDLTEPFSEELEKKINAIVAGNLEKNKTKKLINNSFDIIFEAFKRTIYQNFSNGKIYEENDSNDNDINFNNNTSKRQNKNGKDNNMECPEPYYPSF